MPGIRENDLSQRAIESLPESVVVYDSIHHDHGVYVTTTDDGDIGQVMRFSRVNELERDDLRRRGNRFSGWMFNPEVDEPKDE